MLSALIDGLHDTSLLIGIAIGACVGFVLALFVVAAHQIGKDDYAEKSDRHED